MLKNIRAGLFLCLAMLVISAAIAQPPGGPPAPNKDDKETSPVTLEDVIDFKLNNADINAVVSFISKYTKKPVVKDNGIQAKLTINSPNKIPAHEALDLVYDALRIQGFVVIETEDKVQIVPAADTAKFDIVTFTGSFPPDVARQKGRLVRKLIPLSNVRAMAMKAHLDPLLGKHASVAADERTNQLLITDTVRNIERYEGLVRELDVIGFDNVEVRIVPLEHADATKLAQILNETVVKATAPAGPPSPDGRQTGAILVIADARTNALVIASPVDKMNSIVSFAQRLDVPEPKDLNVHVVPIKYADANEIARSISDIFRSRRSQLEQDTVEVRATGRDNALLILASDENFELIMQVIKSLDTEESQKMETRRYELDHLDAQETATELTKLYGDVQNQTNRSPFFYSYSFGGRQQEEDVKFVPITRSNTLLVIAPPDEFRLIEDLIKEIDRPLDVEDVLPKIYRIRFAKASEVKEVLDSIFTSETTQSGFWDYWRTTENDSSKVGRLTGKVKFTADDNTNSIIAITNNPANYPVIDRMIEQLDTTMPELANTMIVNLQHADAVVLANQLNSLFGKPVRQPGQRAEGEEEEEGQEFFSFWWGADNARRQDERPISNLIEQVRFVPDPRTNSILVTTAAQNFEVIRSLITDLDNEEPQVLIKVRIVEVQRDKDKRLGLRWTPAPGTFSPEDLENSVLALSSLDIIDSIGGGNGPIGVGSDTAIGRDISQTLDSGSGVISSTINLNLLLQMLLMNLDAQIVHSPTLYISNNQKGHLFVGENIPRLKGSTFTTEGTRNDTFENEDIGITMEIIPNISRNGQVVLNVMIETAQRTGQTRFGSDVLQKREYNTKVAVNGGDTMVLGGIRMSSDQKIVRKIPLLGDIPVVGHLFRNVVDTNAMTDLYAFITPHVITGPAEAEAAVESIKDSIGEPDEDALERHKLNE